MTEEPRTRPIAVLCAPSNLGLRPPPSGGEPGVRGLPAALLQQDLLGLLGAADAGVVAPPPYDAGVDPITGVRNLNALRRYTIELAERLDHLLDQACFPLLLGGDCSILLGTALALRRRGRFGLLFVDGHSDLLTPATSQTGGAAGMDLAIVTGTGVPELTSIDGLQPYLQPADVVVFGFRWPENADSPAQPRAPMRSLPWASVRSLGWAAATEQALAHFAGRPFWLHLDADVLAPEWMPAVDSPEPGGLSPDELAAILGVAVATSHCVGLELTIYDPTLDPSGRGAALLAALLKAGLAAL